MNDTLRELAEQRNRRRTIAVDPPKQTPIEVPIPQLSNVSQKHREAYLKREEELREQMRKEAEIKRQRVEIIDLIKMATESIENLTHVKSSLQQLRRSFFEFTEELITEELKHEINKLLPELVNKITNVILEALSSSGSSFISILSSEGDIIKDIKLVFDDLNIVLENYGLETVEIFLMDTIDDERIAREMQEKADEERLWYDDIDAQENVDRRLNNRRNRRQRNRRNSSPEPENEENTNITISSSSSSSSLSLSSIEAN